MSLAKHYQAFWLGLRMSPAKLRLFRFAFFFVFALDAWLQIGNAPRYGFGDFNVAHFSFLESLLPMPTQFGMTVVYSIQVLLGLRIALGGASRATYALLAIVFSYGYFISQLNSYQHHYLLALALGFLAAFPWPDVVPLRQSKGAEGEREDVSDERYWPIRMLLVALSIMYFFAVIAKLDGEWLDGSTLIRQIHEGWIRNIIDDIGWAATAKLVIVVELALVFLIHIRRTWPIAIALGVGMHLTFEFSGLRIGLFSYFMATVYLLFIPESWVEAGVKLLAPVATKLAALRSRIDLPVAATLGIFAIATALAAVATQSIFIDSVNAITWCVVLLALLDLALTRKPAAAGTYSLIAVLGLLAFVNKTDALRTYYHFWGHNDRRLKDTASAIIRYENVVAIDPEYLSGHQRLADSYARAGRRDEALRQYEEGLRIDPSHFKLNRGAAQMHHLLGNGAQALEAAKRALRENPGDRACNQIRQHWEGKLKANATQ